ncbi:lantibiotic dehydratase family protein [Elizabethkingia anophelis]|uniref:lantibiotic dehydratase family protein n=2 Tax=Weeksellaceae TaxID=2762318 RepID=UPI0038928D31
MPRFPYQFFDEFVVRTPVFSYKTFIEQVSKKNITESELKKIYSDAFFQEAVYLASPYLYKEFRKWLLSEKKTSEKEEDRLKNTLLKYYSRISSRCTPFGLFSGVSLGRFSKEVLTSTNFSDNKKIRDTKLDMHFLVSLSQYLITIPEIRDTLLFYPNTSLYRTGNRIRYIEYEYINERREYITSAALLSEELQKTLTFSKQGKTIQQITDILVTKDLTDEEASEFVKELIDNQILVSELEPHVSGGDFLPTLISLFKKRRIRTKERNTLIKVQKKLKELDEKILNLISDYYEIESLINSFQIKYEPQYLFQTDLYYQGKIEIPTYWKKELKKVISFLNKITLNYKETYFKKFKKVFSERFGTEELPLLYVLDTEIGIGYRQDIISTGVHPYLEDLKLTTPKEEQGLQIKLSPIHVLLNRKLQETLLKNTTIIQLIDEDFKEYKESWEDLPDTISIMAEIISENKEEKLFLQRGGGCSAASLLARFNSEKSEVQSIAKEITRKEEELNPDCILAEVLHLPQARIGNIIRRPSLRHYEIPFLAKSLLPKKRQISVDDLYISLKDDRIILRSKRLNKEVKPYLTNAHNYSDKALPVYHFLCDLHSQDIRTELKFDWGDLEYLYTFFPRIEYKKIILSKARWKITEEEIKQLFIICDDKEQLLWKSNDWRRKRRIPLWIQWVRSDHALTLNLQNYDMIRMLIEIVRKERSIFIEEFLYNENNDFVHQFIFPLHKVTKK